MEVVKRGNGQMASTQRIGEVEEYHEKMLFSLFELATFARSGVRFYASLTLRKALESEF
jgi:hypothetical protein